MCLKKSFSYKGFKVSNTLSKTTGCNRKHCIFLLSACRYPFKGDYFNLQHPPHILMAYTRILGKSHDFSDKAHIIKKSSSVSQAVLGP